MASFANKIIRDLEIIKIRELRGIFGCSFRCNAERIVSYVTGITTETTAKKTSKACILIFSKSLTIGLWMPALIVFLGGCATVDAVSSHWMKGWLEPDPTLVEAAISVDPKANINLRGGRAPIKLRFYLLTSTSVFQKASYFALKDQDEDLLAKDLKVREIGTYKPGEQAQLEMVLPPDALSADEKLYVGVWAGYIDLDNTKIWHDAIEVQVGEKSRVSVTVEPLSLSLKLTD